MTTFSFALDAWTPELINTAPNLAEQVERYDAVESVFFAVTSPSCAEQIGSLPGVRSWKESSEGARRVVWSIDRQISIAVAHRETFGTNGVAKIATAWLKGESPKYPTLMQGAQGPVWGFDEHLRIPTRFCIVGALNISLEMRTRITYDPDDPVSIAMSSAGRQMPVVLAAGNVNDDPDPTMFGWPLAPDVISVGAATADLQRLDPCSRRGDGARGIPGPDVVASGHDETGIVGTSFAAPVVSSQLALIAAALLALRTACRRLATPGEPEGVPLVGRCFVDVNAIPGSRGHGELVNDFAARARKLPALPITAVREDSIAELLSSTGGNESPLLALPSPDTLRRLLLLSTTPMAGEPTSNVGAGCVSRVGTLNSLLSLKVSDLCAVLNLPAGGSDENATIFDDRLLPEFLVGAEESMIGWASDIKAFENSPEPIFVEQNPPDKL